MIWISREDCIWEKRNNNIEDPDQKFCSPFWTVADTRTFLRELAFKGTKTGSFWRSNNRPSSLRTVQNDGKISMVLNPLCDYFVFLIYTDGYSNHYGCVCYTVWADNFGFRRRKALAFQTLVCQVTNKFLELFSKNLTNRCS